MPKVRPGVATHVEQDLGSVSLIEVVGLGCR